MFYYIAFEIKTISYLKHQLIEHRCKQYYNAFLGKHANKKQKINKNAFLCNMGM